MTMTKWALGAAAAALTLPGLAAAQDYGTPPGGEAAYGYARYEGAACGGFTLAGAHAGVTVLGISLGAGARARVGADCPPPAPPPAPSAYGAAPYGPPAYGSAAYAEPSPLPYPVYSPGSPVGTYAYVLPSYPVEQVYVSAPYSYAPTPCGCVLIYP